MFVSNHPSGLRHAVRLVLLASLLLQIQIGRAAEPPITTIVFSPDGGSVLTGSQAGIAQYDWPTLRRSGQQVSRATNLHTIVFSPDGQQLAIGGGVPAEEGMVEILSWPELQPQRQLGGHADSVMAIEWIDETAIITASLDHQIVVHDITSESAIETLSGHSKGVTSLCLLRDQHQLVSGGVDQNLRVWDLASKELVRSLNNHTLPVHALALRPGDHGLPMVASASEDKTVRLWQPSIGRMVRFARLSAVPLDVKWLIDGSGIVVACDDGRVRVINPDSVEVTQDSAAVDGWAYSLAVHPRDPIVLVGGSDGQLRRVALAGIDSAR